jgi:hypothetical protein
MRLQRELMLSNKLRLALGTLLISGLAGCQSWQSKVGIPSLGFSQGERQIVKQAKNDPFPSPNQVGMK